MVWAEILSTLRGLQNISTQDFSTPSYNSETFSPILFNHFHQTFEISCNPQVLPPIYLHLICALLTFEILSLMNWIFDCNNEVNSFNNVCQSRFFTHYVTRTNSFHAHLSPIHTTSNSQSHSVLKWGFTRTYPGNQDATLK